MNCWYDFYKDKNNIVHENYIRNKYSVFLQVVEKYSVNKQRILETGSGKGTITKLLHCKNPSKKYQTLDINKKLLKLSLFDSIVQDIRKPITTDVQFIHSHGVLEHFDITDIKQIVSNLKERNVPMVHYVPTNKYKYRSFGNERLFSVEQWQNMVNPDKTISFNNKHDLILIWA